MILLISLGLYGFKGSSEELPDFYSSERKYERLQRKALRLAESDWKLKALKFNVHLHSSPNDGETWQALAKHYLIKKDYQQAENAYENAKMLNPDDFTLYLNWLSVKAQNNGGFLDELEKNKLKEKRHDHEYKPLMTNLLAVDAFKRKAFHQAVQYWESLLEAIPETQSGHEARTSISRLISRAQAADQGPKIHIDITVAEGLKTQVKEGQTLFVFAKAANGIPMPLAAVKTHIKNKIETVSLTLTDAMDPDWNLSKVDEVVIEAFVSKKQVAQKTVGDIFGQSVTIHLENEPTHINIQLDEVYQLKS